MNFKKYWIVYLMLFLVLVALVVSRIVPAKRSQSLSVTPTPESTVSKSEITVDIDTGSTHYTTIVKDVTNAYTALEQATVQLQLPLQTKQYDFGVLIEKIGDAQNSKDKAWIYFLNDKSGEVAADKQPLKPGDRVEWKYITPN